jgi:hypothetical protein
LSEESIGGAEHPVPTAPGYPVPEHLTRGGREAYDQEIVRIARGLSAALDAKAARVLDEGRMPEHTSDDVIAARTAYERQRAAALAPAPGDSRMALLAPILVTIASIGVSVMPNFLGPTWSYGLFGLLVLLGVIGLAMTWRTGTRGLRGSRNGTEPPPDRHSG